MRRLEIDVEVVDDEGSLSSSFDEQYYKDMSRAINESKKT
jgi:hypothetical protein